MGNRAVITFDEKPNKNSIGIYLHWNGGPESVLAFILAAQKLGVRDESDPAYSIARTAQIIGNWFGGTLSVGIGRLEDLDTDNGDNGVYSVQRKGGKIRIRQSRDGVSEWHELNHDTLLEHDYWKPDEKGQNILDHVLAKNAEAFKEKD